MLRYLTQSILDESNARSTLAYRSKTTSAHERSAAKMSSGNKKRLLPQISPVIVEISQAVRRKLFFITGQYLDRKNIQSDLVGLLYFWNFSQESKQVAVSSHIFFRETHSCFTCCVLSCTTYGRFDTYWPKIPLVSGQRSGRRLLAANLCENI